MLTPLDIAIYAVALGGYLAILALTERSAARYVSSETRPANRGRVFVVAKTDLPAPTVHPEFVRTVEPLDLAS